MARLGIYMQGYYILESLLTQHQAKQLPLQGWYLAIFQAEDVQHTRELGQALYLLHRGFKVQCDKK